jgi:hypothetical protein
MANIGTNLGNAVNDIIKWLVAAIKKVNSLIQAGDTTNAALLLADIQTVITTYLTVIKAFLPSQSVDSVPSNFFKQLAWLLKNISWLQVLLLLLTGTDPFEMAKAQAKAVAIQWGFVDEAY